MKLSSFCGKTWHKQSASFREIRDAFWKGKDSECKFANDGCVLSYAQSQAVIYALLYSGFFRRNRNKIQGHQYFSFVLSILSFLFQNINIKAHTHNTKRIGSEELLNVSSYTCPIIPTIISRTSQNMYLHVLSFNYAAHPRLFHTYWEYIYRNLIECARLFPTLWSQLIKTCKYMFFIF